MRVLVMGKARWIHLACGGWTMGWQGQVNDDVFDTVDNAVSLIKALQEHSNRNNYTVVDDEEGKGMLNSDYDVIIHVIAEDPYAEVYGDLDDGESLMHHRNQSRSGRHTYPEDLIRLKHARDSAPTTPIITILYSGRPLYVNEEINLSDAFVAAWLPCKQAGPGLTDLPFGAVNFTGRLSMKWPDHPCQFNIRKGDGQLPRFPYSYGLSYEDTHPRNDMPLLDVIELNTCLNPCSDLDGEDNTWESPDCDLGRSSNV
uniref:beta-glucosidase n=1 Tax=Vitrella brassicaformis TaxID=1169539 RepID=A0A7S1KER5_9ALVE|mmetsp:Transcript_50442/g.126391  ORF Transcript_50442/g.126391 Transcript_50442/m.126391 type:complete len:257 (+) Transcript_50442:260-1030(+)